MKKYSLKIKVLSPLCIQNGIKENSDVCYFIKDGIANHIDFDRVISDLDESKIDAITSDLEEGAFKIKKYEHIFNNQKYFDYKLKNLSSDLQNGNSRLVSLHIKSRGFPYIPGSSLKGALHSVYGHKYPKWEEVGRGIMIRDSNIIKEQENLAVCDVRTFSTRSGGVPSVVEAIQPGSELKTTLYLGDEFSIENLTRDTNNFSKDAIEFINERLNSKINSISSASGVLKWYTSNEDTLNNYLDGNNKLLLRLGYGSIRGKTRGSRSPPNDIVNMFGGWTKYVPASGAVLPLGWVGIEVSD